ncbi:aromatic-ring-hydroxylating dioxygenase subunit beta [Immundisolibacter sp.]|uniref:aromatic-ring-hydroxylating dioxygenase subunit beta n=1 Tax=Immundisolibacter sp. TaxID=1934948 RepID=UPI003564313D
MAMENTQQQVDDATYRRILNFLYDEAELFDQHAYGRWLERVTPDIRYRMPGRGFHEGQAPETQFVNGYYDDDYTTLAVRIDLWSRPSSTTAENPQTITRHFVTNIRAYDGAQPGTFRVTSHVLVFRVRPTQKQPYFFSGRREDQLREVDGELRLAARDILMDEVVLMSPNLSFLV